MSPVNTSEYSRSASGIVNAGTINANLSGGSFTIAGGGSFTNQGAINVSNGDTLTHQFEQLVEHRNDGGHGRDAGPSGRWCDAGAARDA